MSSISHYLEQAAPMFHILLQSGREPEVRWALSRYQLLNPIYLQVLQDISQGLYIPCLSPATCLLRTTRR